MDWESLGGRKFFWASPAREAVGERAWGMDMDVENRTHRSESSPNEQPTQRSPTRRN